MNGAISLLGCILARNEKQFYAFYPRPMGEKVKHSLDYWERVNGERTQTGKIRSEKAKARDIK